MELDELVRLTVAGDTSAWRTLLERITPSIVAMARGHEAMRKLGADSRSDDVSAVTTAVLERLAKDAYKNLTSYLAQRELARPQTLESWLYGAVDFAARDYLRDKFGRAPKPDAQPGRALPSKRELNTQAGSFEDDEFRGSLARAFGLTTRLELLKIISYMQTHFAADELLAMQLYYGEDMPLTELATRLSLADEQAADKLIRKLNARLRHHFGKAD